MIQVDFSKNKEQIIGELSLIQGEQWVGEIIIFLNEWWNDENFIVAETSGSTGVPKKIVLKKENVVNSALATGNFFDFKENDNMLLCMSPKYIAGKLMIVRAIVWKMNLICVEPNSNPLEKIPESIKIDFAAMVPLQLQNSFSRLSANRIKKLLVGGGAIDKSLHEIIKSKETEIYSSYGMTETITHIALRRMNGKELNNNYVALDGVKLSIDSRNCLVISARKIADKDIITNDIVELISDKEFKWIGRFDNVINTGGVKVYPEKVEEILSEIISKPFIVASVEDKQFGEKIILLVESESYEIDLDLIKSLLPKYHNPKEVFFLDEFVRTDSGKIQRNKTLEKLIHLYIKK